MSIYECQTVPRDDLEVFCLFVCCLSIVHVGSRSCSPLPSFSDGVGCGWSVIRGKFIAINAANMSCACPRSPKGLSPSAHLADGNTDLILVRKCSRLDFFRHLLRHTNKDDQVRVKELGLMQLFLSRLVLDLTLEHFTKGISVHV